MLKYLGSKRTLVPLIAELAAALPLRSACDLFAGTTRVGQALRRGGLEVHSNDLATYSRELGRAYIEAEDGERADASELLGGLSSLPGRRGYFTRTFCEDSRYFQPHNGERIDAIRDAIEAAGLTPAVRGLLLTSLMEAADRVDSTTGVQMAYLKRWAPRAAKALELRLPEAVEGPRGTVTRRDANELAPELEVDLVYIDPPYNQHSYFANYHIWETLTRWDAPEAYGIARKREDCRARKSAYNSKVQAGPVLDELLNRLRAPWLIVSFNNEGFHEPGHVRAMLSEHGYVGSLEVDFKRYVGAQIGIHNPRGEKVGAVSHLRNKELLFLVGPDRGLIERALERVGASREAPRRAAASARMQGALPPA
ncbi:MAG TPA: DNA adenine methylase [Solirubrobacteraceae bacterium]